MCYTICVKSISSCSHPLIKHCVALRDSAQLRRETNGVLVEGDNLIHDLLQTHTAEKLFVEEGTPFSPLLKAKELYTVPRFIIEKLSSVSKPQTMIAILTIPKSEPLTHKKRIIALDNVQDPGNVGTIVRTTLAFGWDGIFFIGASCDPFNDKALRAAKGATCFLSRDSGNLMAFETLVREGNFHLVVAEASGSPIGALTPPEKTILLVGNEGHGVTLPATIPFDARSIPMQGKVESLNVAIAASIMMYELNRQKGTFA
jgi:RNA methyltransferase, TrmH family